ncbi:MAG TPA: hypothetical protein PLO37_21075 [Candidatus Hydrogenedentes bacterium]|nr:hypothetical protein [Candidatus Hydrogenedentota bacterium]HPG69347.1 hypothetical protein [Candidatus Hydrogenedentota bacterium]
MDNLVKVAILDNEVEAGLVDVILTERGIPHVIRSYHDSAYDGLFQLQKGWGRLDVPESQREVVVAIIAEVRKDAGEDATAE